MPVFEPSTWAEVEEAIVSNKPSAQTDDSFVLQVRAFTNAPERFLTTGTTTAQPASQASSHRDYMPRLLDGTIPNGNATDTRSSDNPSSPESQSRRERHPHPRVKRSEVQFDDLLGHGRVDLDTQSFVRRYASPANFKQLTMFPSPSRLRSASEINPSSDAFHPSVYLAKVHNESTVDQLVAGKGVLQSVKQHLDTQADAYRSEKFVNAALVEAAFESTKSSLLSISPFANSDNTSPQQDFERAEGVLKSRYEDVMRRESKLAQLQRTLAIYKRYQWVFTLAARLRSAANEDISVIEDAVREYHRAVKWIRAQDGSNFEVISRAIESGFQVLFNALLTRLSSGHSSRQETTKLVAILVSVRREDLLTEALSKRMEHALEGLQKAVRSVDVAAIITVRGTGKMESDVTDLVSRASVAFIEGLSHVWRLGRVLMTQDQWTRNVDAQIIQLCASYAQIIREHLLADVLLICSESVKQIAGVRIKAASDLQIGKTALGPLDDVIAEVVDLFFKSLASTVRTEAEQAAIAAVRMDNVGAPAAQILFGIAANALSQVDSTLLQQLNQCEDYSMREGEDEGSPCSFRSEQGMMGNSMVGSSSAELLTIACSEAPAIFAQEVHERMMRGDGDGDLESAALKVAVCCTELCRSVVERIAERVKESGVLNVRAAHRQSKITLESVTEIQKRSLSRYVELVSQGLRDVTRALVSFPEDELGESMSRTVPIKIEGVSKGVSELALQLALITITTRRKSANKGLIEHILLELIRDIGTTLVDVLSTDKLAYHRAAQLWVDVTFVQEMVTKGADAEWERVQHALDGFARVKERAVQAVLADGFSFSLADMQTLRESVISTAIEEAMMVCDCFQETWSFVRRNDDE